MMYLIIYKNRAGDSARFFYFLMTFCWFLMTMPRVAAVAGEIKGTGRVICSRAAIMDLSP